MNSPIANIGAACAVFVISCPTFAQGLIGEEPALGNPADRITQEDITSGSLSLYDIRRKGLDIFVTPFNQYDGFGDGPMDPTDPLRLGGRPTLQNNGTFIRVNGLDSQSCVECHGVNRANTKPPVMVNKVEKKGKRNRRVYVKFVE